MAALLRSGWRATAFGLELEAGFPAAGLDELSSIATGSETSLEMVAEEDLEALWPAPEARTVLRQQLPPMTLDEHPARGYLLATADFGSYLLSRDGARVRCVPPDDEEAWRWQRFLTGQVLPLAALLRGFEVFHSSAVEVGGRAIAFVGHSGAGKSSLALRLVLEGAALITDDVLVLRAEEERLVAHPGAGLMNLRHAEHELYRRADVELGPEIGRDEKGVRLRFPRLEGPRPLAALYFLDRWGPEGETSIEPIDELDPERLLAASYNFAIRTPERMLRQLDVCARLATVDLY